MTILISHRGNLNGRLQHKENEPSYINEAYGEGFQCEIDLWMVGKNLLLGHDNPKFPIHREWLEDRTSHLLIHAKNINALHWLAEQNLVDNIGYHFFAHENDPHVVTSAGYIIAFPGQPLTPLSIAMKPKVNEFTSNCWGICSDEIKRWQ